MQKNESRPIFVTLHKAQVQVDQGAQHKTRYTDYNRKQSEKEPFSNSSEEAKNPDQRKKILNNKRTIWGNTTPDLKLYY